jgi:hypothetical protein
MTLMVKPAPKAQDTQWFAEVGTHIFSGIAEVLKTVVKL